MLIHGSVFFHQQLQLCPLKGKTTKRTPTEVGITLLWVLCSLELSLVSKQKSGARDHENRGYVWWTVLAAGGVRVSQTLELCPAPVPAFRWELQILQAEA